MRILWFGHPDFVGDDFSIDSLKFDPRSYVRGNQNLYRIINLGRDGVFKKRMIGSSFGIDELFRERDAGYIELCENTVALANKYDVLVMSQFNFLHPFFIKKIKALKVLGMVDDPISTYSRGLVYSHFFDCCFYISQGYWGDTEMSALLEDFKINSPFHLPLTSVNLPTDILTRESILEKSESLVYIGAAYGKKVDTLIKFKKEFRDEFSVYGRWPLKGCYGFARCLLGNKIFPHKVIELNDEDKWKIYLRTKVGLNIHYTGIGNEDGNMRTYEILSTGGLLVQNSSSIPPQKRLFKDGVEAIFYESYDDALDKIGYYLKNDAERVEIALNGHLKFMLNYSHQKNLNRFTIWLRNKIDQKK